MSQQIAPFVDQHGAACELPLQSLAKEAVHVEPGNYGLQKHGRDTDAVAGAASADPVALVQIALRRGKEKAAAI